MTNPREPVLLTHRDDPTLPLDPFDDDPDAPPGPVLVFPAPRTGRPWWRWSALALAAATFGATLGWLTTADRTPAPFTPAPIPAQLAPGVPAATTTTTVRPVKTAPPRVLQTTPPATTRPPATTTPPPAATSTLVTTTTGTVLNLDEVAS